MWYLQGLCSFFYYNTTLFFAYLKTPSQFLWYFAKFLSLKELLNRQLSRWAVLVELSHTPPLLSHWALPRQKFPTWEMMIYISISLSASLHHPIHFATAGHRCASLRKTLSHFQLAIVAVGISLGFKRPRRGYESFAKYRAMGNGQWAMSQILSNEYWAMGSNGQ